MFFFCKQKTAYEMRISDWSSDVCSSDLAEVVGPLDEPEVEEKVALGAPPELVGRSLEKTGQRPRRHPLGDLGRNAVAPGQGDRLEIGRASCRERVCQ